MSTLKKDVQHGRVLFLDSEKNDISAEEFLQFMKEGFVPVIKTESENQVQFEMSGYSVNAETGAVTVSDITLVSEEADDASSDSSQA